jgi:hypothetical protein
MTIVDSHLCLAKALDETAELGHVERTQADGPRPCHVFLPIVHEQAGGGPLQPGTAGAPPRR